MFIFCGLKNCLKLYVKTISGIEKLGPWIQLIPHKIKIKAFFAASSTVLVYTTVIFRVPVYISEVIDNNPSNMKSNHANKGKERNKWMQCEKKVKHGLYYYHQGIWTFISSNNAKQTPIQYSFNIDHLCYLVCILVILTAYPSLCSDHHPLHPEIVHPPQLKYPNAYAKPQISQILL